MKWLLDSIGTMLLTIILLIILHVIAAVLNTTTTGLMPGIVCYIWAYLMTHEKEEE